MTSTNTNVTSESRTLAVPKKRGRPKKKVTSPENHHESHGSTPKENGSSLPKKRGRPKTKVTSPENHHESHGSTPKENISSVPKKRGRPKKKVTSPVNRHKSHIPKENGSTASNSNILKLFPIFNLSATKILSITDRSVEKESDNNKSIHRNKSQKRAGSKGGNADETLSTDSPPKPSNRGRKRQKTAKEPNVTSSSGKKCTIFRKHVNLPTDVSSAENEISHAEFEAPVREIVEYLCSEVQQSNYDNHISVDFVDKSLFKTQPVGMNINVKESLSEGFKNMSSTLNKNVQNGADLSELSASTTSCNETPDSIESVSQRHEETSSEDCVDIALTLNKIGAETDKSTALPRSGNKPSDTTKLVSQKHEPLLKSDSVENTTNEEGTLSEDCVEIAVTLSKNEAETEKSTALPTSDTTKLVSQKHKHLLKSDTVEEHSNEEGTSSEDCIDITLTLNKNEAQTDISTALLRSDTTKLVSQKHEPVLKSDSVEEITNEEGTLSEDCSNIALTLNKNEADVGISSVLPISGNKTSDSSKPVSQKEKFAALFKSHRVEKNTNKKEILLEGCKYNVLAVNQNNVQNETEASPRSVNERSDSRYPVRQNKRQICVGSNVITTNGNLHKKKLHKQSKRGRKLQKSSKEEPVQYYNECINPLSDSFVTGDELPTAEVAVAEIVEYLCTEIQQVVQDSHIKISVDNCSDKTHFTEVDVNEEKCLSQGCTGNIIDKLSLNEKFENKTETESSMASFESPNKISKNDELIQESARWKDGASEAITLDGTLPKEVQSKKSKRGRKRKIRLNEKSPNNNTQICPLFNGSVANDELPVVEDEIKETVEYLCSEIQQDDCAEQILLKTHPVKVLNKNNLSQSSVGNERLGSNKRSHKKKKIQAKESVDTLLQEDEVVENVAGRRKSLRSRGVRDNFVNYSELPSSMSVEKSKRKSETLDKHEKVSKYNDTIDRGGQEVVLIDNLHQTKFQKIKRKSRNAKENVKLFPIFSPKSNAAGKRKAKDIEEMELDMKKNGTTEISQLFKKTKTNLNANSKANLTLNDSKLKPEDTSANKKHSSIIVVSDTENSEESDILVNEDSTHTENGNENCPLKVDKKFVTYKHALSDIDVICFPLFSHLKACDTPFSDISNKFNINEEIDNDVILPDWKGSMGLIDPESTRMIKSNDYIYREMKNVVVPKNVFVHEDMLWTDSSEKFVINEKQNEDAVKEIKSWLLLWKNKFSRYSKKGTDDDSSSDSDEDFISNAIIISGVPGSGKTSLVSSLADELGFTVLEVNASSCRNGRNISHQLKEALESYHVESVKVDSSNVENLFSNVKEKNSDKKQEVDSAGFSNKTRAIKSFFEVRNTTSPQKKDNKPSKRGKSIANFFQANSKPVKEQNIKSKNKGSSKNEVVSKCDKSEKNPETVDLSSQKSSCKISSSTIILFDDVDVVFEEDDGFWSTVKGFLKISKKPVIFTVGRNLSVVKSILNADIRIFNMAPPSKEVAVKRLKEYCKSHSRENSGVNLELLTSHNVCDLRRNILNAQFWTQIPNSIELSKYGSDDPSFKSLNLSKPIHVNSFITGAVQFSTSHIRKLLHDSSPCNFSNAILQYNSLGYDILFNNIFNILYNIKSKDSEKIWKNLTSKFQECRSSEQSLSDSEKRLMWKEACELFEKKKKALKNGSSSCELQVFADAMDDFSFADTLKGLSCNTFQWVPASERVKLWTAGLPICLEQTSGMWDALDIISLIHIYRLRKLDKVTSLKYSDSIDDIQLDLQHPFFKFDQSLASETEDDLECISSVLPPSQLLSKAALNLDYLSTIKIMCRNEESRQVNSGKRSGRFLHYFDSISFYIDRKFF